MLVDRQDCDYNAIYKKVKPLKYCRHQKSELAVVMEKVRLINDKVEYSAQKLQDSLNLANRLVGSMADEDTRWKSNVTTFKEDRS